MLGFIDKLYVPYDKTFGSNFKQGKVVDIDPAAKEVRFVTQRTDDGGIEISWFLFRLF